MCKHLGEMSSNKEALVADCYHLNNEMIIWDIEFVSQAQD